MSYLGKYSASSGFYDLKKIKAIPCEYIATSFGIKLTKKHNRLWGKLRPEERTSSFSINLKNNLWYDFGSGEGGSVIDLYAKLANISPKEAINRLAKEYGIENEKSRGWHPLTDSQYKELGIQPELATMNFDFDLNKHSVEQLIRWTNKYNMHVKELATKYPEVYDKMVVKKAMEIISDLKNSYEERIREYFKEGINDTTREFLKYSAKKDADEINSKLELLQRALISDKTNYLSLKVNPEHDFININVNDSKALSEDIKIKDKYVKAYKMLFNCDISNFTIDQIKALRDINNSFVNTVNGYLSFEAIKKAYKLLGNKLDKLEHLSFSPGSDMDKLKTEISKTKDLFNKCDAVLSAIQEALKMQKNSSLQNHCNKTINNEFTQQL